MKKIIWIHSLVLFVLLITGCSSTKMTGFVTRKKLDFQLANNLNSCVGKLTTTDLLMFASSPTEKNIISDGEIWIYKYRNSKSTYKTTGTGGWLLPYQTEEKTHDYHYDIRLRFNQENILIQWSADGDVAWSSDSPISAQKIPFFFHVCK